MADAFERSEHKMREHGMSDTAIAQFEHLYEVWSNEESTSWIREEEVEPITDIPSFHDVYETINHEKAVDAFAKTAFLKLNGGLGTSMGLDYAKSLLPVRRHKAKPMRFLDIILGQVVTARKRLGVALPLTLMDSFRTSRDTMAAVAKDRHFEQKDVPVEIIQHVEPKIDVATGEPVTWETNPDLEWCPPGHGDLYSTLWESGLLDILEEQGYRYLFISNSDNLGARPSRTLAQHFENTGAPFMIEVARRTEADRKGGHIVRDVVTGRLMLREMTQVADEDRADAMDIHKHPFFNTNNIWVRIDVLRKKLAEYNGVLPLPVIRNYKTVDPTDPTSTKVVQLETAISYEMEDGDYHFPNVRLDKRFYKNIRDFEERFPYGVPSIAAAASFEVQGDWTFGRNVSLFGDARLKDEGHPSYVPNGEYVGSQGIEPDEWL